MERNYWIVVIENQAPQITANIEDAAQLIGEQAILQFAGVEDANILMLLEGLVANYEENPEKFGIDGVGYAYMGTYKF